MMNMNEMIKVNPSEYKGGTGYKVVEVNVSVPADYLYAVCTPVKKQ